MRNAVILIMCAAIIIAYFLGRSQAGKPSVPIAKIECKAPIPIDPSVPVPVAPVPTVAVVSSSVVASQPISPYSTVPLKSGQAELNRWDPQILSAAKSTGLPPNFIKATLWAESRGNPNDPSLNPDGQHTDMGVMQISDYTYGLVMKKQPRAPKGLKAKNTADNIMMGAWELKDHWEEADGNFTKASMAYVGHDDDVDFKYAAWVQIYWFELEHNQTLSDY